MNFNRIQKYRSEKAMPQINNVKDNRFINNGEASSKIIKNSIANQVHIKELLNKKQQSTINSQQSYIHAKGITLRDYLYLASTSSKKASSIQKSKNSSLQSKIQDSKQFKKTHQRTQSLNRREKYQVSNSEIFEIVKNDIKKDLQSLESMAGQLQQNFKSISEYKCLDNSKMIEIYSFRKIVRGQLMQEMKKLNNLLIKIKVNEETEGPMPIIFQNDQDERYEAPIQIQSSVCLENHRRLMSRTYSLNK